jgi:hypothetical protein
LLLSLSQISVSRANFAYPFFDSVMKDSFAG